ncbi:hypothetical protein BCR42DRAFT_456122 [Absidia repens]|uniref:Myb-like domain-containing protein n=1 Tax=Absidia repens TaxID=90262 RepID=A0A1X2I1F3_9FUNG|nr:hypothetical protein BCR42DRAFT_456122 [Absidia repens]
MMTTAVEKPAMDTKESNRIFATTFFSEEPYQFNKGKGKAIAASAQEHEQCPTLKWSQLKLPSSLDSNPILDRLRATKLEVISRIRELPLEANQENEDSEAIKVVRKDNVFGAEMTENEMDIIQQRVARQQQQFAEYEHKEKIRKFKKVYSIYDYLTIEEMEEMLVDCKNDEDEIVVRMTEPFYLLEIRKTIALKFTPASAMKPNKMSENQVQAYQKLLEKRSATLRKTTDETAKKHYRLGGRLALDDAIRQVQEQGVDASTAFEGWSAARIRAYNLIDQNPNSYYYRFNAPGEIQQKGQWGPDERKLFFARLEEVGANGQWGHFAMTIPGRVGYQCSNFYRLLVENGEVEDPNYVLDEKGKAHYLFDKKTANGKVEKTFRTHNKHGRTGGAADGSTTGTTETTGAAAGTTTKRKRATASTGAATTTATSKRKRRARRWGSDEDDHDDDDEEDDDDMFEDYADKSGSYTSSSVRSSTRTSTRQTRSRPAPTTAAPATEAAAETAAAMVEDGLSSSETPPGTAISSVATAVEHDELAEEEYDDENEPQVLPGFIDPITLDEVEKPAISKYGHVMGYDSWVRCLTNWEGKKNICPLTKKPLTKRDLVILTFDNIEEYRDQILN